MFIFWCFQHTGRADEYEEPGGIEVAGKWMVFKKSWLVAAGNAYP